MLLVKTAFYRSAGVREYRLLLFGIPVTYPAKAVSISGELRRLG
jgi:hypothetical protein